jgi:hypothetical protein
MFHSRIPLPDRNGWRNTVVPRHLLAALLALLLSSVPAAGQEWTRKMFTESSHDFGTVARGAKVEYRFQISNPFQETFHIAGVRSSCGCTEPTITKNELKTYEKSEVVANFNTRAFTGNHSATLTVTFDKPWFFELQFSVFGNIRGDVQVQPEQVAIGTIEQGQEADRHVTVTHSGLGDWKIVDVRSVNSNYEVEVKSGPKTLGQVSYDLLVHLKKDAPPGYLKDQLILITNDSNAPQFPIEVEGLVKPELVASPQSLVLGMLEPGKSATKSIVVSDTRRPFKVTGVHCDDDAFNFKVPDAAKNVQVIPVTFTAPEKPGKIVRKILIDTDLGKTFAVEVLAQAEVKTAEASAKSEPTKTTPASDKAVATKTDGTKPASDNAGSDKSSPDKRATDKPANKNAADKSNADKSTVDKSGSDKSTTDKSGGDQKTIDSSNPAENQPASDSDKPTTDGSKATPATDGPSFGSAPSRASARPFRNPFRRN